MPNCHLNQRNYVLVRSVRDGAAWGNKYREYYKIEPKYIIIITYTFSYNVWGVPRVGFFISLLLEICQFCHIKQIQKKHKIRQCGEKQHLELQVLVYFSGLQEFIFCK